MEKDYRIYPVLRAHAIGQLPRQDAETLKEYQAAVISRLNQIDHHLGRNLFKREVEELQQDRKWLVIVQAEIGEILTRELHTNRV